MRRIGLVLLVARCGFSPTFLAPDTGDAMEEPVDTPDGAVPIEMNVDTPADTPTPATCGGMACPPLEGYRALCNDRERCEYARESPTTGGWQDRDEWIYVPPGEFDLGSPTAESGHDANEEGGGHVTLASGFFIAKYEVTVAAYEACEAADACTAPSLAEWDCDGTCVLNRSSDGRGDHPQNGINWQQATDVCDFLGGGRLPTEAQWEYAASGPAHRRFPWGDAPPSDGKRANIADEAAHAAHPDWSPYQVDYDDGFAETAPVGTFPTGASACGAMDMAGNLWEWVEDDFHGSHAGGPTDGSAWVEDPRGLYRIQRGGGFNSSVASARSASRVGRGWPWAQANSGTRCMRPLL